MLLIKLLCFGAFRETASVVEDVEGTRQTVKAANRGFVQFFPRRQLGGRRRRRQDHVGDVCQDVESYIFAKSPLLRHYLLYYGSIMDLKKVRQKFTTTI